MMAWDIVQEQCWLSTTTSEEVHNNVKGSSSFEMKWRESILWSRLNITDLTMYRLSRHLKFNNVQTATSFKILNDVAIYTLWIMK